MSKSKNIAHIELYDEFGNLSMEALIAFAKGELSDVQKLEVQEAIDGDEMYADALEGILELDQPADTRNAVYTINEKINERAGIAKSVSISPQIYRIAAAIALFIALSGGVLYVVFNTNVVSDLASNKQAEEKPLAENTAKPEEPVPHTEEAPIMLDSSVASGQLEEATDEIVTADGEVIYDLDEAPALDVIKKEAAETKTLTSTQSGGALAKKPSEEITAPAPQIAQGNTNTTVSGTTINQKQSGKGVVTLNDYLTNKESDDELARTAKYKDKANAEKARKADEEKAMVEKKLAETRNKLKEEQARKAQEESASKRKVAEMKAEEAKLASAPMENSRAEDPAADAAFSYNAEMEVDNAPAAGGSYQIKNAQFPGGDKAMKDYIAKNLNYPKYAEDIKQEGTVLVSFVVDEKGKVTDAKVARGVLKAMDNEAIRLVKSMPKWNPGEENGKKVKSQMVVPIEFKLKK